MSIVQIARVFGANLRPSEMLVAIILASYADDDGQRVFPAIATIAGKANLDRRTVQRIIRRLENIGYVTIVAEGGGRGAPRRLQLHPEVLEKSGTDAALSEPAKGGTGAAPFYNLDDERAASETQKGGASAAQSVSNRHSSVSEETEVLSITAEGGERRARARRLPSSWRPDPALRAWAIRERPDIDVAAATAKFIDHWRSVPDSKGRKLDWAATFRNWIRGERPTRTGIAERRERWMREITGGSDGIPEADDASIIDADCREV